MPGSSPKYPPEEMEVNRVENVAHSDVEDEKDSLKREGDASSINEAALGDDLPPGYFYSLNFIGTLTVCLPRHNMFQSRH